MEQQPPKTASSVSSALGGGTAVLDRPSAASTGDYPINVSIDVPPSSRKLYAVPILGLLIKEVMLIPHLIVLYLLALVVSVLQLVTWIPVLFGGKYPSWGANLVGGLMRYGARVFAFLLGLTDQYPPFSLAADDLYPVQVSIQVPEHSNRFFAIPVVGYLVKALILIPHIIVLYALVLVVEVLQLVTWIPVLTSGKYPDFARSLVGGTIRWSTRVQGYWFGLTDAYPPFSLS